MTYQLQPAAAHRALAETEKDCLAVETEEQVVSDQPAGNWLNDWRGTAAKLGGVSRTLVFELWKSGELKSVTIKSRRFSTDEQIADYITGLSA